MFPSVVLAVGVVVVVVAAAAAAAVIAACPNMYELI